MLQQIDLKTTIFHWKIIRLISHLTTITHIYLVITRTTPESLLNLVVTPKSEIF